MGNTECLPDPTPRLLNKKFVLELRDRDIILDYKTRTRLKIGDILSFPGGFEGLHLWDSNITLARYIFAKK